MKGNIIIISIIVLVALGAFVFWFMQKDVDDISPKAQEAVSMENDVQVITIKAKGGYSPKTITAKAGVATTLKIVTNGTYDCSSSLVIRQLGFQKTLKPSGVEEIVISADQAKGTIRGVCSMGMYSFSVNFVE